MPLKGPEANLLGVISPECPRCKGHMREQLAKVGKHQGKTFWGCMDYPHCRGTLPMAVGMAMLESARADARKRIEKKAHKEAEGDEFGFVGFLDLDS